IESMVSSTGIICGAGFETPAEALFLKKKLIVIPMKGQYEQQCNAAALQQLNVPVLKKLTLSRIKEIQSWIKEEDGTILVNFPDCTEQIITELVNHYLLSLKQQPTNEIAKVYSFKKLRKLLSKNILFKSNTINAVD
ncbi:MAG TPA: glycosyltransferase family protein, partial [Sphingobacteriaceae bacterium]|nr:glycosyltransferase family protein [Sphingobacteriaceae bacterium]